MKSTNIVKTFPGDNFLAEMAVACTAGLAAALSTLLFRLLFVQDVPLLAYLTYILMGVASYSLVAAVLYKFSGGLFRRILPNWFLTALFGSAVFVAVRLTPGIIGGWYDPLRGETSFLEYISKEVSAARSVVIFLCAITIPIAGFAYYLGPMVKR